MIYIHIRWKTDIAKSVLCFLKSNYYEIKCNIYFGYLLMKSTILGKIDFESLKPCLKN